MTRRSLVRLLTLALAVLMSVGLVAAQPSQAAPTKHSAGAAVAVKTGAVAEAARRDVLFFNLGYGDGVKRPRKIFLSANSGPYFRKLTWTGWDTKHARGRGTLVEPCGGCPAGVRYSKAVVHLKGFRDCGNGVTIYRRGYGIVRGKDGSTRRGQAPSVCPNGA